MADEKVTSKVIDASHLFESLKFRVGTSPKTGNEYVIGMLEIKTNTGRPYRLDLSYLDNNAMYVIEQSLEHYGEQDKSEFAKGLN